MEHGGRKVEVYRYRNEPWHIYIDIMQKEGDCPKGYGREERFRCPLDCQNTFMTFVYGIVEQEILHEGALVKNVWHYRGDLLAKYGFNPDTMNVIEFVNTIWGGVTFSKNHERESLSYKGEEIAFKPECGFEELLGYEISDPKIRQYQELIRRNTTRILAQGGIEFHDPDGSIITFKPENMRDRKTVETDEPTSLSQ